MFYIVVTKGKKITSVTIQSGHKLKKMAKDVITNAKSGILFEESYGYVVYADDYKIYIFDKKGYEIIKKYKGIEYAFITEVIDRIIDIKI